MGIVGGSGNGKDGNYNTYLHVSIYVTDEAKRIANAAKKDKALDTVLWSKKDNNYKWFNNGMLVNPFENSGDKK